MPTPTRRALLLTITTALLALALTPTSLAETASAGMAREVARGWLLHDARPLGEEFDRELGEVSPYFGGHPTPLFFIVSLEPEGFILVAGDDRLEPILAFSPGGGFPIDENNPLFALASQDLATRHFALHAKAAAARQHGLVDDQGAPPLDVLEQASQTKWQFLSDISSAAPNLGHDFALHRGRSSVSDVRVAPLMGSEWSQSNAAGQRCYNRYTPNNYYSGCVATAMAQVMRYHEFPVSGIGQKTNTVYVNGSSRTLTTRGGDGNGGAYDWSLMPLKPSQSSYVAAQWNMVGALLLDAGISVNMMYSPSGSGAYISRIAGGFTNFFGYANATTSYTSSASLGEIRKMVGSNIEGGYPVLLAIFGSGGAGHEVVADGYGYQGKTLYHHLNMGWGGSQDAWYALPLVDDAFYGFNTISGITYNIFPTESGELISGRVTSSKVPISGATVTAQATIGGTLYSTTTSSEGFYGLVVPANRTYNLSASKSGYVDGAKSSVVVSQSATYTCGNAYRANIAIKGVPPVKLTACPLQTSALLKWNAPTTSGLPNDTVYIRRSGSAFPSNSTEGTLVYTGTDTQYEDTSLVADQAYYYTIWVNDGSAYASAPLGSTVQASVIPNEGATRLFFRNSRSGKVLCWNIKDDGTLKNANSVRPQRMGKTWSLQGSGDISGDGIADLVWRDSKKGRLLVWILGKDATVQRSTLVKAKGLPKTSSIIGISPIDGDSTEDLLIYSSRTKKIGYWLLRPDGTFKSAGTVAKTKLKNTTRIVACGDLDADGVTDIVFHDRKTKKVTSWFLRNDGSRRAVGTVYSGRQAPSWTVVSGEDIDGNGAMDLIWYHAKKKRYAVWLQGTNGKRASAGAVKSSKTSPNEVFAGLNDFDNDGIRDMFFMNQSTGVISYWKLNAQGRYDSGSSVQGSGISNTWRLGCIDQ